MTDFPPSDNQEHPNAPSESIAKVGPDLKQDLERPEKGVGEEVQKELHSALDSGGTPPPKHPSLTMDGGDDSEPPARPELFNDAAWSRLGPQTLYARLFRPLFNLALLGVVLLPALALIALISVANWIAFRDHKKVFFKQHRVGYRDKPFELWKFRSMKDSTRPNYETWTEGQEADRVTKLGSFLRRSHLDELPQLFNVLRREMNFIGPRPEMLEINDWVLSEIPLFYRRLAVRPGITGFAQITQGYVGNDIPGYKRKLKADLKYITDLSFRRDLGVLFTTPFWMLRLLGWQNDPADKKDDDDSGPEGGSRMIRPTPRPGAPSNHAAQILEEIGPIPPM
jgi:lipopolysaccharide/colanic/teichoic acid biosynthesis glycosyltransferase